MKGSPIIAVLGLVALAGCSAADDTTERPAADAGRDTRVIPRSDAPTADQLDASAGSDADEASTPPAPDVAAPDTITPPPDVAVPPPDAQDPRHDAGPDGFIPPPNDGALPPPLDVTPDLVIPSCLVTFTVNGVHWDLPEGGVSDAQSTSRAVRLVGDAANVGSWSPAAGVLLAEIASGTWSGSATLRDQQLTEFKFVKLEGATPEWESWLPYDSNRSLRVGCFEDGGALHDAMDAAVDAAPVDGSGAAPDGDGAAPPDAGADATGSEGPADATAESSAAIDGPADVQPADAQDGDPSDGRVVPAPARGRSYAGAFGVRPLDATK